MLNVKFEDSVLAYDQWEKKLTVGICWEFYLKFVYLAFFGVRLVERKKTEVSANLPSWVKAVF